MSAFLFHNDGSLKSPLALLLQRGVGEIFARHFFRNGNIIA